MLPSERHAAILTQLRAAGHVHAETLADSLGVTVQTIRRDLSDLADTGALTRVHGGATLPSGVRHSDHETRAQVNARAKARIGAACAALVPEAASLFLGIGTTPEAVARALAAHRGLLVVTNNLNVPVLLASAPDCRVTITGGDLRAADNGLVGPLALRSIETFRFDLAVIGTSALDGSGDLLDFDMAEVQVNQTLLRHARRTILVADASKFSRTAPIRVGNLRDFDHFVTDQPPPAAMAEALSEAQTSIDIA